ncbi:integration host factor subunit alpha [Ferrimonas marina]|uniref:Integration host factor subunit alpha n=1 Tax=Ferrimonas marina TaxID=299255 RepID=A0A1M5S6T8_9GAMM|nr:integration host factor subunit alpha [Ferrimonas marina]SHH33998.1 integration host factor subunit alpha [Ferrimonas marina]
MSLTKADLTNHLVNQRQMKVTDARDLVDTFFEEIRHTLEAGEEVKLSGFGVFHLRTKNARPGRNPKTGQEHEISARRVVTFSAGGKLKGRVATLKA